MRLACLVVAAAVAAALAAAPRADAGVPTPGAYQGVALGHAYYGCAHRLDGTVACWNVYTSYPFVDPPPTYAVKSFDMGYTYGCAITETDTVACWNSDGFGAHRSPTGAFRSVASALYLSCGVRADSSVSCWGDWRYSGIHPPGGAFSDVDAGYESLAASGATRRWPAGPARLTAAPSGLRPDQTARRLLPHGQHWPGQRVRDQDRPNARLLGQRRLRAKRPARRHISRRQRWTCQLRDQDRRNPGVLGLQPLPPGRVSGDRIPPPTGTYTSVSSGAGEICAIRTDQALLCWGGSYTGYSDPTSPGPGVPYDAAPTPTPTAGPTPTPTPAATPTPQRGVLRAATAFSLPSAHRCLPRGRRLAVRIRALPGVTWIRATVKVLGKVVKTLKGARTVATIRIARLPNGRFRLSIAATAADGRRVTTTRTYRTCAS